MRKDNLKGLSLQQLLDNLTSSHGFEEFAVLKSDTNSYLGVYPSYEFSVLNLGNCSHYGYIDTEIGTIVGNKIYTIYYAIPNGQYSNYKYIIQRMIKSIQFFDTNTSGATSQSAKPSLLSDENVTTKNFSAIEALNDKATANALYSQGKYAEAITYLDKALVIDPKDKDALNRKGNALSGQGNDAQALQYYDKALAIDPNYKEALFDKADSINRLGKYAEAITYYDKALAIDPNYKDAIDGKNDALSHMPSNKTADENKSPVRSGNTFNHTAYKLNVDGTNYPINYQITGNGNRVDNITTDQKILLIDITSPSPGTFTIELPRSLIDSKNQGTNNDSDYVVLTDGTTTTFDEISTSAQNRTLSINFPSGSQQLEIIGSSTIPNNNTNNQTIENSVGKSDNSTELHTQRDNNPNLEFPQKPISM